MQTQMHLQKLSMERQTRQQLAVMQVIHDTGRSLSPLEVWSLAQEVVPRINLSTVYRQLKVLQTQGRIIRVDLPGQDARFEAVSLPKRLSSRGRAAVAPHPDHGCAELAHHHHFHCLACEQVFPLHACPGGIDKLAPRGYEVQRHDLTLHGRCPSCVRRAT